MLLSELPRVESLMEQGRLGDLVTRRVVEKYLLPDFEENQRNKARRVHDHPEGKDRLGKTESGARLWRENHSNQWKF